MLKEKLIYLEKLKLTMWNSDLLTNAALIIAKSAGDRSNMSLFSGKLSLPLLGNLPIVYSGAEL